MNKQRKVVITTTYNEMGIIIDTKTEELGSFVQPEPCEDAVSREEVLNCLEWQYPDKTPRTKIMELPSVTPKQRTGKWIYKDDLKQHFCSECGYPSLTYDDIYIYDMDLPNFCEECGAKMEVTE